MPKIKGCSAKKPAAPCLGTCKAVSRTKGRRGGGVSTVPIPGWGARLHATLWHHKLQTVQNWVFCTPGVGWGAQPWLKQAHPPQLRDRRRGRLAKNPGSSCNGGGEEEKHPRPNFQAVYYQGEAQEVPRMRTKAASGSLSASSSVAAPMRMPARPPFINGSLFGSSRLTSPQA